MSAHREPSNVSELCCCEDGTEKSRDSGWSLVEDSDLLRISLHSSIFGWQCEKLAYGCVRMMQHKFSVQLKHQFGGKISQISDRYYLHGI